MFHWGRDIVWRKTDLPVIEKLSVITAFNRNLPADVGEAVVCNNHSTRTASAAPLAHRWEVRQRRRARGELSAPPFHCSFHSYLAADPSCVAETLGKLHEAS